MDTGIINVHEEDMMMMCVVYLLRLNKTVQLLKEVPLSALPPF